MAIIFLIIVEHLVVERGFNICYYYDWYVKGIAKGQWNIVEICIW